MWGLISRKTVHMWLQRESIYNFKDKFVIFFNLKSNFRFKWIFSSVPGYSFSYAGRPGAQDLLSYINPSKVMLTVCCTSVVSLQFVNEVSWTWYSACVDFLTLGSVSICEGRSKSLWTFLLPVHTLLSIFQHHNNLLLPDSICANALHRVCSFLSIPSPLQM